MKLLASCLIVVLGSIIGVERAFAQTKNTVGLEPAFIDVTLAQKETEYKSAFTIRNNYDVPVELTLELQAIDEQNGLFLPSGPIDEQLSSALMLSSNRVVIPENSNTIVYLNINAGLLTGGGHYATLVLTQEKVGTSDVAIKQSLSAGIFIIKEGGQIRQVEPGNISYGRTIFGEPKTAEITLKNTGNTHIIPRASVSAYRGSTLVYRGVYNIDSKRVLPGKEHAESVLFTRLATTWLPSKLKVIFEYRADSIEEFRYSETYFWYIPARFLLLVTIVLALGIVFILRHYKYLKLRAKKTERAQQKVTPLGSNQLIAQHTRKKVPRKIPVVHEE